MSDLMSFLGFGSGDGWAALIGFFLVFMLIALVIALIVIISLWKIFTKAGQPGWAAVVPFYGYYIEVQIAGLPIWYFIIACIPSALSLAHIKIPYGGDAIVSLVYLVTYCIVVYNLAKKFGKGVGYTLGMIFLPFIFYPMLAFGDSVYQGGQAADSDNESDVVDDQPEQVVETPQANEQAPAA